MLTTNGVRSRNRAILLSILSGVWRELLLDTLFPFVSAIAFGASVLN